MSLYLFDVFSNFSDAPWKFGCPVPCTQTSYTLKLNYFHKNVWLTPYDFTLLLFYESLYTEQYVESLDYDVGSFLASAGGNLSLMLGFSCLSVVFALIDYFQRVLSYHQK